MFEYQMYFYRYENLKASSFLPAKLLLLLLCFRVHRVRDCEDLFMALGGNSFHLDLNRQLEETSISLLFLG